MNLKTVQDNSAEYADSERIAAWTLSVLFLGTLVAAFFAASPEFQVLCYGAAMIAGLYYLVAAGVIPELCYPDRPQWAMRALGFGVAALAAGVALPPFVAAVETYRMPLIAIGVVLIGAWLILSMRAASDAARGRA